MINVAEIVRKARTGTGGPVPVLSASFDLPPDVCRQLYADGLISAYVADSHSAVAAEGVPLAGVWTNRELGLWKLDRGVGRDLLFLGYAPHIGVRMLLIARGAGYRTLQYLDIGGEGIRTLSVSKELIARGRAAVLKAALHNRLVGRPIVDRLGIAKHISYEAAFRWLFDAAGDRLKLKPDEVVRDRAMMILGSLGPGGAERQAAFTASGLAAEGTWKPLVACNFIEGPTAGFHRTGIEAAGVEVRSIPVTPPEMSDPVIKELFERSMDYRAIEFNNIAYTVLSYVCAIRSARPALVQTWMDYCNVLAGVAAEIAGVPALVLSGRSAAPDNFAIFQPYMRAGYLELLSRRSVMFTNNSANGARDYGRWLGLPEDRFVVLRNGFEFPAEKPVARGRELRRSLGIPDTAPVMGTIIRFTEEKQPLLWLETAQRITAAKPEVHCVAFGDGAMLAEVRAKVETERLGARIHLPGLTREPWAALSTMDVFVLTSRLEGLPNVLVEAQAMGLPVVTTGRGGMSETYVAGITGLTAGSATANELSASVLGLLDDHSRLSDMSDAARRHARREFGLDRMLQETLTVFDRAPRQTGFART